MIGNGQTPPVDLALEHLEGVRQRGDHYMARCPAHDDRQASLSVRAGDNGDALLKCHAGCEFAAIVAAMGLKPTDLFTAPPKHSNGNGEAKREIVATYDYTDEAGKLLYQAVRFEPKGFAQRQPDPERIGGWNWSMAGARYVLFQLPEVLKAVAAKAVVFVVEGEKDVLALGKWSFVATTNAAGAGKWRQSYAESLRGARVVIVPDADAAGQAHAHEVGASLQGLAREVKLLLLPDVPEKGDVSDWIAGGGTREAFIALVKSAPAFAAAESNGHAAGADVEPAPKPSEIALAKKWVRKVESEWAFFEGAQWYRYQSGRWVYSSHERAEAEVQHWMDRQRGLVVTSRYVGNVLSLARNLLGPHEPSELNSHPTYIPLVNGVYDTETGNVLPHSPRHWLTNQLPYSYNAEAACPLWDRLLREWMLTSDGEVCEEWIGALQEWFGYCLVPDNRTQTAMVWLGEGQNGKGVATRILQQLVGPHQWTTVPIEQLHDPYHRADLHGKLLGFVNEPDPRSLTKNGAHFKAITGEDAISARRPTEKVFSFTPYVRLVISCNAIPGTRDLSRGFFRRLVLIEWRYNVSRQERDLALGHKLRAELPGIFNWAMVGLRRFRERGSEFADLPESEALLSGYKLGEDTLAQFIESECELGAYHSVPFGCFYESFRRWCLDNGYPRVDSSTKIGLRLKTLGYDQSRGHNGGRVRQGIRLRPDSDYSGLRPRAGRSGREEQLPLPEEEG